MTTISKIDAYRTSDGSIFESIEEAEKHCSELNLENALEDDPILGNYEGCTVSTTSVKDWLRDNKELVQDYLRYL